MLASFQSTHPVWGGTPEVFFCAVQRCISIHPPRVGWDKDDRGWWYADTISIHPPRVGWDGSGDDMVLDMPLFQSTHPVWGGTCRPGCPLETG